MEKQLISIIIPVRKEENVDSAIEMINKADYPKKRIQILVIEGNHPSVQRNEAIKKAKGEYIFFLDNDSEVIEDYFNIILKHFKDTKIGIVGGPAETKKTDSFLQKCFGYVLGSYFATGKMRAKFKAVGKMRRATEKDLILCNMAIRKSILPEKVFDPLLFPNEENELMNRLKDKYIFIYDPKAIVYRSSRKTLFKFMKQFFGYGRGRVEHILLRPKFFSFGFFIPLGFLIYLLSLFFIRNIYYLFPLLLYIFLSFIFILKIILEEKSLKTILCWFLFPIVHISYAVGNIYGFFSFFKKRKFPKKVYFNIKEMK